MEKLRQFNTSGYIWETNNISIEGGEVKEISLDNSEEISEYIKKILLKLRDNLLKKI